MKLDSAKKHFLMRLVIVVNVCMMAYTINDLVHVAYLYDYYNTLVNQYYDLSQTCHD